MKASTNNAYGYKVCYIEKHKRRPHKRFITHSYKKAVEAKQAYYRYPPPDRDGKDIVNVKWEIYPITKQEVKNGIWYEVPFY